jgi:hypothetical protein
MNAITRTYIDTGCVFRPNAWFCDNVGHCSLVAAIASSTALPRLENKEFWTNAAMTYVTKMAKNVSGGSLVLTDFVSQDREVGDYNRAAFHFDESRSVQPSEISGYELSNGPKSCR